VGEAEMQHLVGVLLERLHLHTGYSVVDQPGALWGHVQALTWVPGHVSGHLVVAVELLPPQELVPGHGLPLAAHQTGGQYVRGAQAQEDLVDEAVREQGRAPLVHCDILPRNPDRLWLRLRAFELAPNSAPGGREGRRPCTGSSGLV
uniref:Uncharacterized protein n=1 Tax=Ursus americanus TaxID=9643 RepID=A0A452QBQ7_URSAM